MSIKVRAVSGALGCEVTGIDLTNLTTSEWGEIHDLWLEYLVLFFPDQSVDPDAHVALARRIGEPEIHPYTPKLDARHPEVSVLDGVRADTWHTDVTFSATPPMASVLHMATCPPVGGDTMWTNQYLVYETLSAPMRDLLWGLTAVHTALPMNHPEVRATHPVVRTHPETGRLSLFVNRGFTSHLDEVSDSESEALLQYLFTWSERPEFQCRYRWTPGAVGMWDNRCTQHYGVYDYSDQRVIHRVTVIGDRPLGGERRWPQISMSTHLDGEPVPADPRTNSIATQEAVVETTS